MSQDPDALATFQAITESFDDAVAIEYLSRHQWDVISQTAQPPVPNRPQEVPQSQRSWFRYIWDGVFWVSAGVFGGVASFFGSISDCHSVPTWRSERENPVSPQLLTLIRDSCPDVSLPTFETNGYRRAALSAAMHKQPLLVYMHQRSLSPSFLKDVLFAPVAVDIIREHFVMLVLDEQHPDYQALVAQTQMVPPPVLVAVHMLDRQHQMMLGTLVSTIQAENVTQADVIEFLDRTLMQDEFVTRESADRMDSNQEKILQDRLCGLFRIRQEQEVALREAERMAQEKEVAVRMERQRREKEEEERKFKEAERIALKTSKRQALGQEPADSTPDIAHIAFRLPDGSKTQRNFLKTDTVETLYTYIDTLESDLPAYEIATSFPSHSLSDKSNTLEKEGLCPRAVLHEQVEEFQEAMRTFYDTGEEEPLFDLFRIFDRNGDQRISRVELKLVMDTIDSEKNNEDAIERMIMEADLNHDGFIDLSEFISVMKKHL